MSAALAPAPALVAVLPLPAGVLLAPLPPAAPGFPALAAARS
jgi:hypothetical protein